MSKTLEEAAREAVREEYLCESCAWKDDCDLCGGENTAFDCCECPADSYEDGFKAGAAHIMSLPLASRLTAEEKERVRKEYANILSKAAYYKSKMSKTDNPVHITHHCNSMEFYVAQIKLLERIFGKELFQGGRII